MNFSDYWNRPLFVILTKILSIAFLIGTSTALVAKSPTLRNGNQSKDMTLYVKQLYGKMKDKNKDTAYDAFIKLTEVPTKYILAANSDPGFNQWQFNFCVPSYADRFLLQLTELTRYCRSENVNYKGTSHLKKIIDSLAQNTTSYKATYELENYLIKTLKPDEVTAIEYWAAIYEKNWRLTYSAGRILDKFYTMKFPEILSDKRQLCLFLKKAFLYKKLGIIGSCNLYLAKFSAVDKNTLEQLRRLDSEVDDSDIKASIYSVLENKYMEEIEDRRVIAASRGKLFFKGAGENEWPSNMDILPIVSNFEDSLKRTWQLSISDKDKEEKIRGIAELADYSKLGIVLPYLKNPQYVHSWDNSTYLRELFGVPIDYNRVEKGTVIDSFLQIYNRMDEESLYQYYLTEAGIRIRDEHGNLDYDNIFDILKFDYSTPFVGGNRRDFGVFAVVRILEMKFDTRLGLPPRHQHRWGPMVHSFIGERRTLWMNYLTEHRLVKINDNVPPSFMDFDVY